MSSAEDLLKRSQAATVAAEPAVKKPQMYRLDL
jgi:hypothetical protein